MKRTCVLATAAAASGDTVKTLIETTTMPAGAIRLVGVASVNNGGAATTHSEPLTGVIDLESTDVRIQPMQLPIPMQNSITSGMVALNPYFVPVDVPLKGKERISAYVTLDLAQTGGVKSRVFYMLELDD